MAEQTRVMWAYPESLRRSLPIITPEQRAASDVEFQERHKATLARIDDRVRESRELRIEMAQALAWCRANGNPHTTGGASD